MDRFCLGSSSRALLACPGFVRVEIATNIRNPLVTGRLMLQMKMAATAKKQTAMTRHALGDFRPEPVV